MVQRVFDTYSKASLCRDIFLATLLIGLLFAGALSWSIVPTEIVESASLAQERAPGGEISSGWIIEVVDIGGVGEYASLGLDDLFQPHISYYDEIMGDLKYAWRDQTGWHTETVDTGDPPGNGDVGIWSSLALDNLPGGASAPHIAYYDSTNLALKYARFEGGLGSSRIATGWHTEIVDREGDPGDYASLELDSAALPHIGYFVGAYENLMYARFDGTSWMTETVDDFGYTGFGLSLFLDDQDRPHISYCGILGLQYAYYDPSSETETAGGAGWQIVTADGQTKGGTYTSLALDSAGRPHISYYDVTYGDLKYAHLDGSWQVETVEEQGFVGFYSSLALDKHDRPHISYHDWTNGDLKYTYYDAGSWHVEVVDSAGEVGLYTSLVLDPSGQPYIAYHDATDGTLKLAYKPGPFQLYLPFVQKN